MNDREKKLIFFLLGIGFLLANVFAYTSLTSVMKKKESSLKSNVKKLETMRSKLASIESRGDEIDWYNDNVPKENTQIGTQSELLDAVQRSMGTGLQKKASPKTVPEPAEQGPVYHTASVRAFVTGRDPDVHRWIVALQDPKKFRSVTYIKLEPKRGGDDTLLECEIIVTQWYLPKLKNNADESVSAAK